MDKLRFQKNPKDVWRTTTIYVWNHKENFFGPQNHLKDVDETKTSSDHSSPVADNTEVEVDLFEKMADVRLVLMLLDVLLVVHRLTVLCLDVRCLNTRNTSQQPTTEVTPGDGSSPEVKSTTEVRPDEDKQSLIHLKTDREQIPIAGSQSQRSSWSRDNRTCPTREDDDNVVKVDVFKKMARTWGPCRSQPITVQLVVT